MTYQKKILGPEYFKAVSTAHYAIMRFDLSKMVYELKKRISKWPST